MSGRRGGGDRTIVLSQMQSSSLDGWVGRRMVIEDGKRGGSADNNWKRLQALAQQRGIFQNEGWEGDWQRREVRVAMI